MYLFEIVLEILFLAAFFGLPLAAVAAAGTVSTLALVLYTISLFSDCSIISYIANWR